jgi:uncharacterized protein DUF1203
MLDHTQVTRPAAARQVRGWLQAWPYWPALSHPWSAAWQHDVRFTPDSRPAGGHAEVMATTDQLTTYEIRPIDPAALAELRLRDDAGRSPRLLTDAEGGSPLRCCLRRIVPGERVALVSYAPLRRWAAETWADPGPYDETGPVFIHPGTCPGPSGTGYPADLSGAPQVFRAYHADGRILGGRLFGVGEPAGAQAADAVLTEMFADPDVALIHVRAVEFGCFTFEARRRRQYRPSKRPGLPRWT